ncbi:hypothetical protein [Chitinivibrio alkaliphilus]|uniref:Uncharacterized protein n=1 Tax=Chitinivibrio alkaliphilus ACht1 TaxID=1313304 RepID=U7D7L7_9BACT|nr:hypothetical protein [Chitinivibrio alkaliphilus]ERP31092.1 hypothetical protein CALK_2055 [Chitinivibrio alkaliphilus ACht1]
MNTPVQRVYNLVKRNPRLKLFLKNAYQAVHVLPSGKKSNTEAVAACAPGFFFGFHDKCPWNSDDTKLLAHRAPATEKERKRGVPVEIGYFDDVQLRHFTPLGTTRAWNWQQGAMLQWDPIHGGVFYNDLSAEKTPRLNHIASAGEAAKDFGPAAGAISPCGNYLAHISFYRFGTGLHGYEYQGVQEDEGNENVPQETGGFSILARTNEGFTDTIHTVPIAQLRETNPLASMDGAYHYVSHPQFSPDSNTVAFFHRWVHRGKRNETRLYFLNLTTHTLTAADTGTMVSHFCWIDSHGILAFYEGKNGTDYYGVVHKDGSEKFPLTHPALAVDGHPCCHIPTGRIVTDTYPDKKRHQHLLYLPGIAPDPTVHPVAKLYAPFRFQELFRADLHPRWNRAGDRIAVDCSYAGRRSLAILPLEDA